MSSEGFAVVFYICIFVWSFGYHSPAIYRGTKFVPCFYFYLDIHQIGNSTMFLSIFGNGTKFLS
ncbi:hypothetical protein M2105_000524 [Paenibacillus sp. PastF-1]|nr:hypothetical protein [Paenibacillus sp. PastF-2]MDF9846109.1 hypothetical protein [Paenibacillus sp. PastM-2]MDF9852682.1 hypothetical protein [Paenibacillus sp. PastF-1]MDH6477587.1 hypothetical protein [Paenibacillus sp. PastH-2]